VITTNYFIVAGISALTVFAMLLHLRELDLIKKESVKFFRWLGYFIVFSIVSDVVYMSLEGNVDISSDVLYGIKTINLALTPVLPYMIVRIFYYSSSYRSKILRWIIIMQVTLILIIVACLFVSVAGHYFFIIDENNRYQRTGLTIVYAVVLALVFVLMIVAIGIFSKRAQNMGGLTLTGVCLMLIAGFVLRILFVDTDFGWLCIAISYVFVDIYYVDMSLRLDPLTHMLNRHVYETTIRKINFSTLVVMIDANRFKSVNDKYGHECGDKTLHALGKCIRKAYGDYGWCFRIGGDEFCVILKPDAFKMLVDKTPKNDIYVMADGLMKKLDDAIRERDKKDSQACLEYGVSQGYGVYYDPSEYPSILDHTRIEQVIKIADERMYQKKAEYKRSEFIEDSALNKSSQE
jgi:diguanylate cyclase (GGDEF)-like protein